jgi:8-oxo-dGTP pyrophosphatase MutT (NUDIX family)
MKIKKVAVIAVQHPDEPSLFLYGLRRDTGTWCIPGGHMSEYEKPLEAARRELKEETGLDLDDIEECSNGYFEESGSPIEVYLFRGRLKPGQHPSKHDDPDNEFIAFSYLNPLLENYKRHVPKEKDILVSYLQGTPIKKSESQILQLIIKSDKVSHVPEGYVYVAMDGDNAGSQVERAAAKDDVAAIKDISERIKKGSEAIKKIVEKVGAEIIVFGGDDVGFLLPEDQVGILESVREAYYDNAGFTITAGVGHRIPEAVRALLYGKMTGKNKTVMYRPGIDIYLEANVKPQTEAEKISESGVLND